MSNKMQKNDQNNMKMDEDNLPGDKFFHNHCSLAAAASRLLDVPHTNARLTQTAHVEGFLTFPPLPGRRDGRTRLHGALSEALYKGQI